MKSTPHETLDLCSVAGCGHVTHAGGYCAGHYQRVYRYGDPLADIPLRRPLSGKPAGYRPRREKGSCSVEGCDNGQHSSGYCSRHYQKWRKYGDPTSDDPAQRTCAYDECREPHYARGWCKGHYEAWRAHKPLSSAPPPPPAPTCSVDGCGRPPFVRGWCESHYRQWKKYGDPLTTSPPRCSVVGCERAATFDGYCDPHYWRWYEHGDPLYEKPARRQSVKSYPDWMRCSVEGCTNPRILNDLCHEHSPIHRDENQPAI